MSAVRERMPVAGEPEMLDLDVRAGNHDARRGRRVRALMLTAALLYVLVLLVLPLAGIAVSALKGGLGNLLATLSQPDVLHALLAHVPDHARSRWS